MFTGKTEKKIVHLKLGNLESVILDSLQHLFIITDKQRSPRMFRWVRHMRATVRQKTLEGVVAIGGRGSGYHKCFSEQSVHKASPLTRAAPAFLTNEKPTFTEPPSIAGSVRLCQNNQPERSKTNSPATNAGSDLLPGTDRWVVGLLQRRLRSLPRARQ